MADKKTFYALATGWIGGRYVQAGDPVELTATAAKYENVADTKPKKAAADK